MMFSTPFNSPFEKGEGRGCRLRHQEGGLCPGPLCPAPVDSCLRRNDVECGRNDLEFGRMTGVLSERRLAANFGAFLGAHPFVVGWDWFADDI